MSTGYLDANFENWDGGFSIIILQYLAVEKSGLIILTLHVELLGFHRVRSGRPPHD